MTFGCDDDAHMAQRIHHPRGMLMIDTAVAELPTATFTKGVQGTLLGHDEAVRTAGRRVARPEARKRFHAPRQPLIASRASMAALPESALAPAEGLALLFNGQALVKPCGN